MNIANKILMEDLWIRSIHVTESFNLKVLNRIDSMTRNIIFSTSVLQPYSFTVPTMFLKIGRL